MPADVFENFRNKCIETYELDPFSICTWISMEACLKKPDIKLELLADNNMLMMVEKRIKGGVVQAIQKYAKANNKYMKNYDKNTESPYLMYSDGNNFYGRAMFQKLSVNGFKWKNFNLMKTSYKIMMKIVIKDIFLM